ncbi:YciI family protein [Sphingosinicella sp.]|uniref:YciI family protein n=1 Tax=Sphingosinicella sp. TaxID=1917971 RepID=UPI0040384E2F
MELYAIWRRRSGGWLDGQPLEAQEDWAGHAAFMMAGVEDGRVRLAGPVDDKGALIVVRAESPEAVEAWLAGDPWTRSGLLVTERIGRWQLRIGSLP